MSRYLVVLLALAACSAPVTGDGTDGGGGGTPVTTASGLPCDVADVLQRDCLSCHSDPPTSLAPMPLVTYAQLSAKSSQYPSQTYALRALERMKDTARPMPPGGGVSAADVTVMENWVNAGAPAGSCNAADGGTPPDPLPDNGNTCTSGKTWTRGNRGSQFMHPGVACIQCHSQSDGPTFLVAGTVFPSVHEPDDCNGSSDSTITIEITDANGQVTDLHPNSAGNFFLEAWGANIATPYHAKVTANGKTRSMIAAQISGDCNSCHTQSGDNSAPGRIVAP